MIVTAAPPDAQRPTARPPARKLRTPRKTKLDKPAAGGSEPSFGGGETDPPLPASGSPAPRPTSETGKPGDTASGGAQVVRLDTFRKK